MTPFRAALSLAALLVATVAHAAFSDGLSPEERAASGVAKLAPAQVAALDGLIARDVELAHQGGVTGFSSDFAARHTAREREAAGIDRLSEKEVLNLDALAARAISLGPPPSDTFTYQARPKPPVPETIITEPPKLSVHGDVAVMFGAGSHGTSFFGTSADVFVTDPSGKFTLGVGVSEIRSRGYFGPYGPYCAAFDGPPFAGW
jgi:hypothetical protein